MPPSVRSVRSAPTAPTGRAMLRNVGGGTALSVEFDVRTAFDFAISLAKEVGEHDELPEDDRRWLERARAGLPAAVRPAVDDDVCIFAAGLLVDHPEILDAAGLVALVGGVPASAFVDLVLADSLRDPERREETRAARDGDPAAIESVLAAWPEEKQDWVGRLFHDPAALMGEISALMGSWLPVYQEIEPRIGTIIRRDADLRARDRATLGATELIERTTNGIRWLSEPGLRRVILAPSYLARPYNFTFAGGDWRMFVYPVLDEALEPHDPLAPPQGVLRLHRALGDGTRLRILRLLRDRDWYLTEIAERLELSKPTIKHHLAQLRAAGLVTLTEEGGLSWYSLRRDRLDDASSELKRYLI